MRIDFTFGGPRSRRHRAEGAPARILILGDLQHEAANASPALSSRPIVRVDADNIEDLLARYAPAVVLGTQAGGEALQFRAFGDFHPDSLVDSVSVFRRLLDLRRRVAHAATFESAVAELWGEGLSGGTVTPDVGRGQTGTADEASTFARLLGREAGPLPATPPSSAALSAVDRLIRETVAPYVVAAADPQLPQLISAVDGAMTDLMRSVLHDPGFQDVEATWRAIQWLVSSLELDEDLELYLLHLTRAELSQGAAPESPLYRRLVEREARTSGGLRFSALIGNYRFGATPEDLIALESMGTLARALDAPFVAECGTSLLGTSALAQRPDPRDWSPLDAEIEARWAALRAGPAGAHVGLALPRVLLRLPYGGRSDPIERFRFEEQPAKPDHESFLWGNAAFACAMVMARLLRPEDTPGDPGDITDLPAFVFTSDDEPRLQPCAEVGLGERAVDAILSRGIMPLLSLGDRAAVRLVRLQSIADPPAAFIGW